MVRASAGGDVDLGLIPSRVKPITFVFTASLLDVQHQRDSVENKPASLLVVPLGNLGVVERWLVTSKPARYYALIAFS